MGIFKSLGSAFSRQKKQSINLLACACRSVAKEPEVHPYAHPDNGPVPTYSCGCGTSCECGKTQCDCTEQVEYCVCGCGRKS